MAKHGYMIEASLAGMNVDSFNRTATATVDVDGGQLVTVTELKNGVATVALADGATDIWMAYNPSEHFTEVNGNIFAGLSTDPRDYTNLKGRPFDIVKLQKGDVVKITKEDVDGTVAEKDKLKVAGGKFKKATAGADDAVTVAVVREAVKIPFPQAGIGMEYADAYVCEIQ